MDKLCDAFISQDGSRCAVLLKTSLHHVTKPGCSSASNDLPSFTEKDIRIKVIHQRRAQLGEYLFECLQHHAEAIQLVSPTPSGGRDAIAAYKAECSALGSAMKAWRENDNETDSSSHLHSRSLPILYLNYILWALASNVRQLAMIADRDILQNQSYGSPNPSATPTTLSDAASVLRKCFADAQKAVSSSKKQACLEFVNQLFCIFFRLNTLGQCKHLMRTVDQKTFPSFDLFPASQRVTYCYYAGRLCVFHDEFDQAMEKLTYALRHCYCKRNVGVKVTQGDGNGEMNYDNGNKRRILQYLIPVRMLSGVLPKKELLAKYQLEDCFTGVVNSIRNGDMRTFEESLRKNFLSFVRSGTYLLMEKMRMLVYRTALKKIYQFRVRASTSGAENMTPAHQIKLEYFRSILMWMGADLASEESSMDEVECIVANLIYRKYVKGYISHQKRILVVSKQEAFPLISSVPIPID